MTGPDAAEGVPITADGWMKAAEAAAADLAAVALGGLGARLSRRPAGAPPEGSGAYLPLVGDVSVMIGLVVEPEAAVRLARAVLGCTDAEPAPVAAMVADAVGEVVNILAGGIKRRMKGRISGLQLGLPVFLQGRLEPTHKVEAVVADLRLGDIAAVLVIALPSSGEATGS